MATKKSEVVKTPKKSEENEQLPMAQAFRNVYEAYIEVGFSEEQAYDLLKTTMLSPALTPPRTSLF